jgi:hypothetical protein
MKWWGYRQMIHVMCCKVCNTVSQRSYVDGARGKKKKGLAMNKVDVDPTTNPD